jgi:serine O-acetyltransferase
MKRGFFAQLVVDAVELTRALHPQATVRDVARTVVANDAFQILVLSRAREALRRWRVPGGNHLVRRLQTVVYGIEINNGVELGDGVDFVHPVGIVVGGNAKVGHRVRFFGSNTLGNAKGDGYPTLEDDVVLGAGARVLGPIRVGARSVIGANAVVLHDVPPDSVVTGIPGRARKKAERP